MEFINLSLSLSLSVYLSIYHSVCLSFDFPHTKSICIYLHFPGFSHPFSLLLFPFLSPQPTIFLFSSFLLVIFLHPTVPLTLLSYSIFFYLPRPILFSFFISSSTLPFSLLFSSLLSYYSSILVYLLH